jgi:RsiW-degrading membrane proteinase PrsW (M82 family)
MLPHELLASAIVPSFLLVWYFHGRDLYPEPGRVIWTTFGLGVATIPAVLLVAVPLSFLVEPIRDPYAAGFLGAFLTAAIPEESFKFLVVRGYCARHREFNEPMDGVVYGAVASLGFATLENILYVVPTGFAVAVARALMSVPGHAFLGAIMGYYVGRAKFHSNEQKRANRMAYIVPILLHGMYDYPLFTLETLQERGMSLEGGAIYLYPITLAVFVTTCIWGLRCLRRARADQVSPTPRALRVRHDRFWIGGTVLLFLGLGLANVGAIEVLRVVTAITSGQVPPDEQDPVFVWAAIGGVLPLLLGLVLFGLAIRFLNRSSVPVSYHS